MVMARHGGEARQALHSSPRATLPSRRSLTAQPPPPAHPPPQRPPLLLPPLTGTGTSSSLAPMATSVWSGSWSGHKFSSDQ